MFSSQNISLGWRFLRRGLFHTASYLCNPGLYRAPFPLEWVPGVREEEVRSIPSL